MPHVTDGDKYYIRREYTEVNQLNNDELINNNNNESKELDSEDNKKQAETGNKENGKSNSE